LAAGLLTCGCQKVAVFPDSSMSAEAKACGAAGAYDTNGDGLPDFFTFADAAGRINRIAYDQGGRGIPGTVIDLDAIPFERCRHLVLVLDGFGYDAVKEYYDSGGLRYFHAPSRVLAPYPPMTDTALEDVFGYMPCPANEAEYYDRAVNETVGGGAAYLAGKNMPYNHLLNYRAGELDDALGYLWPRGVFKVELKNLKKLWDQRDTQELLAYFSSSAGISTKFGKEGQHQALRQVDQVLNQIMWETHGLVKFTLLADHGHSYTPSTRIPLEKALEAKGWRITDKLLDPNVKRQISSTVKETVYIRFGLETYAAFYTDTPGALADDLLRAEGVELATYADGNAVIVLGGKSAGVSDANAVGRAAVRKQGGRYSYEVQAGDPLQLKGLLASLKPDAGGFYDANEMLAASIMSYYPAALERVWRAHFGLVEHPPDVIVSLEDRFYSGSEAFGGAVTIASTHGGLNRLNSTTFIMSMAGDLPPYMRSREVGANMKAVTGKTFPAGR
jgi:hypothetical protein